MILRQGKHTQLVKDQRDDVCDACLHPALRLRSQVPTWASILACTSDPFRSSWRPGLNHTPRMWTGPSLQPKSPDKGMPPLQASNRRASLLSKFILAPAMLVPCDRLLHSLMSKRRDAKTVISSAYAETFAVRGLVKGFPRRAGFLPSFLSLRCRGFKARM